MGGTRPDVQLRDKNKSNEEEYIYFYCIAPRPRFFYPELTLINSMIRCCFFSRQVSFLRLNSDCSSSSNNVRIFFLCPLDLYEPSFVTKYLSLLAQFEINLEFFFFLYTSQAVYLKHFSRKVLQPFFLLISNFT